MELTKDIFFGVHSVAILDPKNGYLPYTDGIFEVVGNVNFNSSVESVDLTGGSNSYPFASESGAASSEITILLRQMNQALARAALDAEVTITAGSTTGTVNNYVNTKNSTVKSATIGVATVAALSGSEANLKVGMYLIKAMSATTVNIYATTNIGLLNGTDVEIQDTDAKLLAANLTITTGGNTDVSSLGIRLTGGSGTIGMTSGDVAAFEVAPAHAGIKEYSLGTVGSNPPYVGIRTTSAQQADGTITQVFLPKVKLNGLPLNFTEKAFGEFEVTGKVIRAVNPFNTAEQITGKVIHITGA